MNNQQTVYTDPAPMRVLTMDELDQVSGGDAMDTATSWAGTTMGAMTGAFYGGLRGLAYGGLAGDSRTMNMVLVTEELSKACGGISLAFASTALGALPIIVSASDEVKQRFLPAIASGERLAAFALTEPQAEALLRAPQHLVRDAAGQVPVSQDKQSVRLRNDQSLVFHGTVPVIVHTNVLMDHSI